MDSVAESPEEEGSAAKRRLGLPELVLASAPSEFGLPDAGLSREAERDIAPERSALLESLALNALLILAFIFLPLAPAPVQPQPIPVHLVTSLPPQAPPPPKPAEAQQNNPPPPVPRSQPNALQMRRASVDMGNPDAPKDQNTVSNMKPAGPPTPESGSEQPEEQADASLNTNATPSPSREVGTKTPQHKKIPSPLPRKGGSKVAAYPDAPSRTIGHYAQYPGPDATKDEYLAYLSQLIFQNHDLLSPGFLGSRRGIMYVEIVMRPSGAIVWAKVEQSSGWADIDQRAVEMVDRVSVFPPMPASTASSVCDNDMCQLTLTLPLPPQ